MDSLRKILSWGQRFIRWTPADLFYRINPTLINAYSIFHSKLLRSNLKLLFINIIQIGVLLDIFLLAALNPFWERVTDRSLTSSKLYPFLLSSALSAIYHIIFLLLRHKEYIVRHQGLISGASLCILFYLIGKYQVDYHQIAPTQLWVAQGLLKMLVAVFYCQGSFACSMFVWIVSGLWLMSGVCLSSRNDLQVILSIPVFDKHVTIQLARMCMTFWVGNTFC